MELEKKTWENACNKDMKMLIAFSSKINENRFLLSPFQVLILRNFGALCVGETVEETTYLAHLLVTACGIQVL